MNHEDRQCALKLADDHWEYVAGVLGNAGMSNECIEIVEFHYKTAFIHGFKHGIEYEKEKRNDCTRD